MEALTEREWNQANTITEKEEMLRQESIPPNEHDQFFELPPAVQAHQSVTEQAVEQAAFAQSFGDTQGPDKVSFGAVHLLWELERARIVVLAKAVVLTGRHPTGWKRASGVVTCTAGTDDYTKPKVYRFISLLSCMGNVVEKVVAELLAEEAERRGLLSNSKYGSTKRRSAIDPAAIVVERAHAAGREDHITGIHLMDIKTAFPSIGRGRLIHTMIGKGMDGDLIRWMASVLTDETVEMLIAGNVMERHPVEPGIPQSSPVSPILIAICTSGLMNN